MSKQFELGQKVTFVRMTPEDEPVYGDGVVVAKLIGISKRINYSVKEGTKAWNLEPEALDCTPEENAAYLAHHARVTEFLKEFKVKQQKMVDEGNAEIDRMHDEFFSPKMDV